MIIIGIFEFFYHSVSFIEFPFPYLFRCTIKKREVAHTPLLSCSFDFECLVIPM